jgi:hypothetical protein
MPGFWRWPEGRTKLGGYLTRFPLTWRRAFALLDVAYQTRPGRMSVLKVDPRFDALRDDPRFDDLLRRMNFPD